ncbi:MAG: CHAP domain-containing protein [Acidobacteria bacterium]|nr:CHAP domain-containing protein [Acidobacteriota bacterium]
MTPTTAPRFPGAVIRAGAANRAQDVLAIQRRLNQLGCGPVPEDGVYGTPTVDGVSLFQARSVDRNGHALEVDGRVGPMTWESLFGQAAVQAVTEAPSPLLKAFLAVASAEVGVMEVPPGSNRGPKVDEYIKSAGLDPSQGSFAWCACFVYWCCKQAAVQLGRANPAIRTAGVNELWRRANSSGIKVVTGASAIDNPELVLPGQVFTFKTSATTGHTGIVEAVHGGLLTTIEGNTNDGGSREGVGVFRRKARKIGQINLGFIEYA